MAEKGIANDIDEMKMLDAATLDQYIGGFLQSLKGFDKKTGSEYDYEPSTISSYFNSIAKKLQANCYKFDITHHENFKICRSVLSSKRKNLKDLGKGNKPNKSEGLSEEDEEKLWEKGVLGTHNPEVLLHTVWFHLTKQLGHRGVHESRQIKPQDFTFVNEKNENGEEKLPM